MASEISRTLTLRKAREVAGSLSYPQKMPGTSYALPASACILGAKLARIPGTACSACYALKGTYARGTTLKAMRRRLAGIAHPLWADAMVELLQATHAKARIKVDCGAIGVRRQRAGLGKRYQWNEPGWHRWHDSGDLQSVDHLAKICEVARRTPRLMHWLPTQELSFVRSFIAEGGAIPPNLVIRVSSIRIGDKRRRLWPHTSSVYAGAPPEGAHACPAPKQGHKCGPCRACWSPSVAHVAYELH